MNVSGLRRNIKNIAHNYTDAQVKVREATSNDPWGPPSSIMSEVADLTYNVVAFTEVMQMIWKRLNDHGKNWRHVYKALVLLDYLIKCGNEKVAQQCKENIYAIITLKDFQYYEDNKDQGMNVREKAKQLVALLKDDERLKVERGRALKARERFAQQSGLSNTESHSALRTSSSLSESSSSREARNGSDMDLARPSTAGEEELQLQLAIAMSREEAEAEESRKRSDELRLALAISQSRKSDGETELNQSQPKSESHLLDLMDLELGPTQRETTLSPSDAPTPGWVDPWGTPAHPAEPPMPPRPKVLDPWASPVNATGNDPWGSNELVEPVSADPWAPLSEERKTPVPGPSSPWSPNSTSSVEEFDLLSNRPLSSSRNSMASPSGLENSSLNKQTYLPKRTPEAFLGANANLVNLDNLVAPKPPNPIANPFSMTTPLIGASQPNPFQPTVAVAKPSINDLRNQSVFNAGTSTSAVPQNNPWAPVSPTSNPFLAS
ncbi:epsin-2-like [Artemia franciscana]|uniref:ENTH domain-containing protein n=1 Tax=Artemia franciscana TaxID=6661 RepID=A0AA88IKW1_ARTSF|nr:hypothetical protein QYM36_000220 [Artemia franciscana]